MGKQRKQAKPQGPAAAPPPQEARGGWSFFWNVWLSWQRWLALVVAAVFVLGLALLVFPSTRVWLFSSDGLWSNFFEVAPLPPLLDSGTNQVKSANVPVTSPSLRGVETDATGQATARSGEPGTAVRDGLIIPKEDQITVNLNEGNKLLQQGKIEEAVVRYRRVIELNPESEDAHFNLGIALARQGKTDEAIKHYQEALRIMPDYAEAHNNLGNLLVAQGKHAEAIEHFNAALRVLPDHASAHNNLGTALGRQGKVSEAIAHFSQAVRLMPDYMEAHFNLGNAYFAQNRLDEAIAEYSQVLRLKPDFEPALRALTRAREKQRYSVTPPLAPPP
jgi:Flp pilus assembly protein TadD